MLLGNGNAWAIIIALNCRPNLCHFTTWGMTAVRAHLPLLFSLTNTIPMLGNGCSLVRAILFPLPEKRKGCTPIMGRLAVPSNTVSTT